MPERVHAEPIEPAPFTFTYTLEDAGWASATWETAGRAFRFSLSYLGDPLGDLLRVLNELDDCYDGQGRLVQQADEQNGCDWQGEPERYDLLFNPLDGRRLRLTITHQADRWVEPTEPETWLETVISLDDLQQQAFTHAESILRDFGLSGYRRSWIEGDFPISDFLRLRSSLLGTPLPLHSLAAEADYFGGLVTERRRQEAAQERMLAQQYRYLGEGLPEYLIAHQGLSAFLLEVVPALEAVFGADVAAALCLSLNACLSSGETRLEVAGQTALDPAALRRLRSEFRRQWWNANAHRAHSAIHFQLTPASRDEAGNGRADAHE